jgi:hypothetical protein
MEGVIVFAIVIIMLVMICVVSIPLILLRGYILCQIWNWFIPENFEGAPEMTIPLALGISLLITILTMNTQGIKADMYSEGKLETKDKIAASLGPILSLLTAWGLAAIIKFNFM